MATPSSPPTVQNLEEPPIHWREMWQILIERRWIGITTVVLFVSLTLIWNFRAIPIYRATTQLKADWESPKILNNIQNVVTTETQDWQYLNTQMQLLQTRPLAERVAKTLQLDKNPDFLPGAGPGVDYAGAALGCLSVRLVKDTRLIDVNIEHPNPKIAAQLADGFALEFIQQNLEGKLSTSLNAVAWLRDQAEEQKIKLEKSEAAIQEYRDKTRGVSLEDRQNIVVEKLKALSHAVTEAKSARLGAEIEWKQVKALLDAGQPPFTIPAIGVTDAVASLRKDWNTKQIVLTSLRERYQDQHPSLIVAKAELKEIQSKLDKACQESAEGIKSAYLLAKTKEESLQVALTEQEQQALDLDRILIEYERLKRTAELDRQLFEAILTRMKETTLTSKLETNDIHIVNPARVPGAPSKPPKARNTMMGIMAGIICGLVLSFLVHFYDDKVKSHSDIETYLRLPLLACVPRIKLGDAQQRCRIVQTEPRSIAAEAFRNLRASIHLTRGAKEAKLVLITSAGPGEGKSLVASNLAAVFANNGEKTLLIDADMRRPMQQKVYGTDGPRGLSQFLADTAPLQNHDLRSTDVPNLEVMTSGVVPPNPTELLGSSRLRELLDEAVKRYDRVVIDSPPITAVSDSLLLLPFVEGVVLVVHFCKVRKDIVARALQKLRESDVPIFGAVLNNINIEKKGYYYYYPYHYTYYDQPEKKSGAKDLTASAATKPLSKNQ